MTRMISRASVIWQWLVGVVVLCGVLLRAVPLANTAATPLIAVTSGSGMVGGPVTPSPIITLSNNGTASITSFSLDLSYDTSRLSFQSAQLGSAAGAAGKQLVSSTPSPGRVHLIIFGLNQTPVGDGETAQCSFNILGTAIAGPTSLTIVSASASNASAQPVAVSLQSGTITIGANQAPFVSAGSNTSVTLPNPVSLTGQATDDGLPNPPSRLTTTWTMDRGPGTVTFANAAAPVTTASFSAAGSYMLRLTGDDGALSTSDIVTITVTAPAPINQAPVVNAGADQTLTLPAPASLGGTVTDDGLPTPATLTSTWRTLSGPGTVSFASLTSATTTASFSSVGSYVLQLTGTDGALSASDTLTVTVSAAVVPPLLTLQVPTTASVGAASVVMPLSLSGSPLPSITALSLDVTYDSTRVSFSSATAGAAATTAGKQLTSHDSTPPGQLHLVLFGLNQTALGVGEIAQLSFAVLPSAPAGTTSLALQNLTASNAAAQPVPMQGQGGSLLLQAAADVAGPILSVTASPSTPTTSDPVTFTATASDPSGLRTIILTLDGSVLKSCSSSPCTSTPASLSAGTHTFFATATDNAPAANSNRDPATGTKSLTVAPINQAPMVNAGVDQVITLPATASLSGTVSDDGLPTPATLTSIWRTLSGPGTATFSNAASVSTNASVSVAGTYVLRLSATDGVLAATDDVTILVRPTPDMTPPTITVIAPADGALVNTPSLQIRGTIVDSGSGVASARLNGQALTLGAGGAFQQSMMLQEGRNTLTVSATDTAGNTGTVSVEVTLDTTAPVVVITSPTKVSVTNATPIAVVYTVDGGVPITEQRNLVEGATTLSVQATDAAGNTGSAVVAVTLDTQAPVITIIAPIDGAFVNTRSMPVQGRVTDALTGVQDIFLNDQRLLFNASGDFTASVMLAPGSNSLMVRAMDGASNTRSTTFQVTLDTIAPVIQIQAPADGTITNQTPVALIYTVDGGAPTTENRALTEGSNTLTVSQTDPAGNTGSASVRVTLDTLPPVLAILSPADGSLTNQTSQDVRYTVDGGSVQTQTFSLTEGANTLTVSATDAAGNSDSATVHVTRDTIPPVIRVTQPEDGTVTRSTSIQLVYTIDGGASISETRALTVGDNTLTVSATDAAGNTASASVHVTRTSPVHIIKILQPENGTITNKSPVSLVYTIDGGSPITESRALQEGPNTLVAGAAGSVGGAGSASVTVTLDTIAPVVRIVAPANGTRTRDRSVSLKYTVDGGEQLTETRALVEGSNVPRATATDRAGNVGSASVTVVCDTTGPIMRWLRPTAGSTVHGIVAVDLMADDPSGVSKVQLFVDGQLMATDTNAPYSFRWDTSRVVGDTHLLRAEAFDRLGNKRVTDSITVSVTRARRR